LVKTDKQLNPKKLASIVTNQDKTEYADKFEKTIIKEFGEHELPSLKELLAKAKEELEEERNKFDIVSREQHQIKKLAIRKMEKDERDRSYRK